MKTTVPKRFLPDTVLRFFLLCSIAAQVSILSICIYSICKYNTFLFQSVSSLSESILGRIWMISTFGLLIGFIISFTIRRLRLLGSIALMLFGVSFIYAFLIHD